MAKHLVADRKIRKVLMAVNNDKYLALQGLKFFDKKDNLIFEIEKKDNRHLVKEVLLQENEKIVGFESKDGSFARHYDLQFVIATLN
jgi:hypothetical protein